MAKRKILRAAQYIKQNPHSDEVVDKFITMIKKHIESHYFLFTDWHHWYVGISKDPDNDRTKSHKSTKRIKELANHASWYVHSLANAREIEKKLCTEMGLGNCKVLGGVTWE